jgi:hypothetical protein
VVIEDGRLGDFCCSCERDVGDRVDQARIWRRSQEAVLVKCSLSGTRYEDELKQLGDAGKTRGLLLKMILRSPEQYP